MPFSWPLQNRQGRSVPSAPVTAEMGVCQLHRGWPCVITRKRGQGPHPNVGSLVLCFQVVNLLIITLYYMSFITCNLLITRKLRVVCSSGKGGQWRDFFLDTRLKKKEHLLKGSLHRRRNRGQEATSTSSVNNGRVWGYTSIGVEPRVGVQS